VVTPPASSDAFIRRFRAGDWDAVYGICVDTAESGQGGRGRYSTDDLVPDIYAGPYLVLEPGHAYVLDDGGGRAVGYVIGTASTEAFVAAYQERWLPRLRERYSPPPAVLMTREDERLFSMFHPERLLRPELAAHPAHLHIDLDAAYRGAGHGRALIDTFLDSVAADGAASCHLSVAAANTSARGFYDRLGWRPVEVANPGRGIYLVKPTGQADWSSRPEDRR
jgi:ribosomal protein S18 acetylase RimI-like enzyme